MPVRPTLPVPTPTVPTPTVRRGTGRSQRPPDRSARIGQRRPWARGPPATGAQRWPAARPANGRASVASGPWPANAARVVSRDALTARSTRGPDKHRPTRSKSGDSAWMRPSGGLAAVHRAWRRGADAVAAACALTMIACIDGCQKAAAADHGGRGSQRAGGRLPPRRRQRTHGYPSAVSAGGYRPPRRMATRRRREAGCRSGPVGGGRSSRRRSPSTR
jgi:hypothetical protein